MKELLERLAKIYYNLNERFNGELIDKTEIIDVIEMLQEDFENEYTQLKNGIKVMEGLDLGHLTDSNDGQYIHGMVEIYGSILELGNYFQDLYDIHVKISKKFRYISGEISLEEYLDDGVIKLEELDDETEDL